MSWRLNAENVFRNYGLTDVYEFGVFTGESVYDIQNIFNRRKLCIRKFFCFDSFVGLPEETKEPIYQECWRAGNFNASQAAGVSSVDDCIAWVDKVVRSRADFNNTDLVYVAGFYEDSLQDSIVKEKDMRPAAYVDLDADLYCSTYTALDFMCRNGLIVPGTILGYDDWGGTPNWQVYGDGESRAHAEICAKYRIVADKIVQFGGSYPHVQSMFIVKEVLGA